MEYPPKLSVSQIVNT
ncbi:hypothetical protein [Nostoc commune]